MAGRISPEKPAADNGGNGESGPLSQNGKPAARADLRARLRASRAAMGAAARAAANARIAALLDARMGSPDGDGRGLLVIAAFWPIGDEPDLRPLLARWASDPRWRIALPVIERRAAPLAFHAWKPGAPLRTGDYGIPEPAESAPVRPGLVLVPTLGFTDDGDRVGYGGGFYDRTLALLRAGGPLQAWGVAYACGRLAAGEHAAAPHDARLDAVVTEAGWFPRA